MAPSEILNNWDSSNIKDRLNVSYAFVDALYELLKSLVESGDKWHCNVSKLNYIHARHLLYEFENGVLNVTKKNTRFLLKDKNEYIFKHELKSLLSESCSKKAA